MPIEKNLPTDVDMYLQISLKQKEMGQFLLIFWSFAPLPWVSNYWIVFEGIFGMVVTNWNPDTSGPVHGETYLVSILYSSDYQVEPLCEVVQGLYFFSVLQSKK